MTKNKLPHLEKTKKQIKNDPAKTNGKLSKLTDQKMENN